MGLTPKITSIETADVVRALGAEQRLLVRGSDSGGAIAMWEEFISPGYGPPLHVHHREDEIFQVVEGDLLFWSEGQTHRAGPGTTIFLPRDVPHTFLNASNAVVRVVLTVTPGGVEGFFADIAADQLTIPESMPELVQLAGRYGLEFLGPNPLVSEPLQTGSEGPARNS